MSSAPIISIQNVLKEKYPDTYDEVTKLLDKCGLMELINQKFSHINKQIEFKFPLNAELFATVFLTQVNSKLENVDDVQEKEFLKQILSTIGNYLTDFLFREKIININDIKKIQSSITEVSEINGYDLEDLNRRLQLERIIQYCELNSNNNESVNKIENPVYYEWQKKDHQLDQLARDLKSDNTISSVKDFKALFSSNPSSIAIKAQKSDYLVVLFDVLHKEKFIKAKGKKGKFVPLMHHCVDHEGKKVFQGEAKYINQKIKRSNGSYTKMESKAYKWLR